MGASEAMLHQRERERGREVPKNFSIKTFMKISPVSMFTYNTKLIVILLKIVNGILFSTCWCHSLHFVNALRNQSFEHIGGILPNFTLC
jgi:hypothetical protein